MTTRSASVLVDSLEREDQVGTVRRAYAHFGLELDDAAAAAAMQAFLDDNPADKHGRHLYRFEDVGLDEQEVRARFQGYQRYFDIPSEAGVTGVRAQAAARSARYAE